MTTAVGMIGLGAMGKPIAALLLKAGFPVSGGCDVRREPLERLSKLGGKSCASPAEVARHSDIVLSLVSNASQTMDVVFGAEGVLSEIRPGTVLGIGSTLGPEPVRRVAEALERKQAHVLDMPISGGLVAAREGTLSVMAGGEDATLDRAMPMFRAFAREITRKRPSPRTRVRTRHRRAALHRLPSIADCRRGRRDRTRRSATVDRRTRRNGGAR